MARSAPRSWRGRRLTATRSYCWGAARMSSTLCWCAISRMTVSAIRSGGYGTAQRLRSGRPSFFACQQPQAAHSARESQAGTDDLCLGRQREHEPPGRNCSTCSLGSRPARSLQGWRPGADRSHGRASAHAFRRCGLRPASHQVGRLSPLAIGGDTRFPALPQVPTFTEAGLPGFRLQPWQGIFAPARTPMPIIDRLGQSTPRS